MRKRGLPVPPGFAVTTDALGGIIPPEYKRDFMERGVRAIFGPGDPIEGLIEVVRGLER